MRKTDKVFKELLPSLGYQLREGQEDMAIDVALAIIENRSLIVEAGVGIGKSFAYLVPLLLYNDFLKQPVVISTSTISLQEQLLGDIDSISKIMGFNPTVNLVKGMGNYLCPKRTDKYLENLKEHNPRKYKEFEWLEKSLSKKIVDRAMLPPIKEKVWESINISGCTFKGCDEYRTCHYPKMREGWSNSHGILLCNHDLLVVDRHKRRVGDRPILPEFIGRAVIDEAHGLEEKVRNFKKLSWTEKSIISCIEASYDLILKSPNSDIRFLEKIDLYIKFFRNLFQALNKIVEHEIELADEDMERFEISDKRRVKNAELFQKIIKWLEKLYTGVQMANTKNEEKQGELISRLDSLLVILRDFIDLESNSVIWIEVNSPNKLSLCSCTKRIDEEIARLFFSDYHDRFILTSATLTNCFNGTVEERYEHFINNTGFNLDDGDLVEPKLSLYPYNENAIIYYADDLPHPTHNREEFLISATKRIQDLLTISKGKGLILFTAKKDLTQMYDSLSKMNLPFKLLKQQEGSSQKTLIDKFREDTNSVLLSTGVFWEGINVSGISLSHVIIVRLPFPVPDPINKAKRSLYSEDVAFSQVDIPEMLIKLRQGAGRLIRSETDTGIVSILDPRVGDSSKSPCKQQVWESLPIKKKTNKFSELQDFVKSKGIV